MKRTGRPKRTDWPECLVEGCNKSTKGGSKGMCGTHYMAVRRGRLDSNGKELRPMKRITSYGSGARCLMPGCLRRPKGRGLCMKHYQQWENGIDLGIEIPERGHTKARLTYEKVECIVDGCGLRPVNRWMCSKHAQQREAGIIDEKGNKLRDFKPWCRPRSDRWVGQQGYVLVKAPEGHPSARVDGSILEHRLVMEEVLGRYLKEHEIVHHKDGDPGNNNLDNLVVMDGRKGTKTRHPPGHEYDPCEAAQIMLQQSDLPKDARRALEVYLHGSKN